MFSGLRHRRLLFPSTCYEAERRGASGERRSRESAPACFCSGLRLLELLPSDVRCYPTARMAGKTTTTTRGWGFLGRWGWRSSHLSPLLPTCRRYKTSSPGSGEDSRPETPIKVRLRKRSVLAFVATFVLFVLFIMGVKEGSGVMHLVPKQSPRLVPLSDGKQQQQQVLQVDLPPSPEVKMIHHDKFPLNNR